MFEVGNKICGTAESNKHYGITNASMLLAEITEITTDTMQIKILAHTRTAMVESPIPRPFTAAVVTASVGHIPRNNTKVGFSFRIPFKNIFFIIPQHPPLSQFRLFVLVFPALLPQTS